MLDFNATDSVLKNLVYVRGSNSNAPRVLHISPLPPPWGGVAANISYLLESNAFADLDMAVLNTARKQYREDVNPVKRIWHVRRLWQSLKVFRDTWRALRKFRPQIVHIQSAGDDLSAIRDMLLIPIAQWRGCLVVFQEYFWPDPAKFIGPKRTFKFFYKWLIPRADAILMSTPLHIEKAAQMIDVSCAQYLPTTCAPPAALPVKYMDQNDGKCQIVYVGRLSRLKGTYDLIAAIARLLKTSREFRFVLIGVGATDRDDEEVARLIAERGLGDHVVLAGRVSDEEKWRTLSESQIMVFPSLGEQFGVTLLEGLAAGLPIVTTSVDYLPRLITDCENGLIVPPGAPAELAEALIALWSKPETRRRMSRNNRNKFETEFGLDVIAGRLRRIYENLLAAPEQ